MQYINKLSNLQDYALTNLHQYLELFIYTTICFFIPLFLSHPQLLVGTVVNALLITAALNLKGYKLLPVIIAPALGAVSRGMLFGPFTVFLLYLLPFIWIGNSILVFSFKYFKLHKKQNYIITLILGSFLKAGFLFLAAFTLYKLNLIPVIFLTAMGLTQFTTAILGGLTAYGLHESKKKFLS